MNKKIESSPPLRMMIMTWLLLLVIYFTPLNGLWIILKIFLSLYLIGVILNSFRAPIWEEYETMGAFITMQTLWFAGILWMPNTYFYIKFILGFLICLGIGTMLNMIKTKNEGGQN